MSYYASQSWSVVTEPVNQPVTAAMVKEYGRITTVSEAASIGLMIEAATKLAQVDTGRLFINQIIDSFTSEFHNPLRLAKSPASSVTSVKYLDTDVAEQTLASSVWDSDINREPAVVFLKDAQSWPSVAIHPNAVRVTYVAGYGPDADDVDPMARLLVLMLVNQAYTLRLPVEQANVRQSSAYRRIVASLWVDDTI